MLQTYVCYHLAWLCLTAGGLFVYLTTHFLAAQVV